MRAAAVVWAIAVVLSGALALAKPLRVIVDFNTLVASDAGLHSVGAIYDEGGLRFTAIHGEAGCCPDKDAAVLARLVDSVGDRALGEVSAFHLERWNANASK